MVWFFRDLATTRGEILFYPDGFIQVATVIKLSGYLLSVVKSPSGWTSDLQTMLRISGVLQGVLAEELVQADAVMKGEPGVGETWGWKCT